MFPIVMVKISDRKVNTFRRAAPLSPKKLRIERKSEYKAKPLIIGKVGLSLLERYIELYGLHQKLSKVHSSIAFHWTRSEILRIIFDIEAIKVNEFKISKKSKTK
jgi:hypothetical protein